MRRPILALLPVLGVLLSVPVWAPRFWVNIASQALIFAVFAMSLDLLLGYGGMPSFGHAAFYGAAAYVVAMVAVRGNLNFLVLLGVGLLTGAAVAVPMGVLALRATGIYFLMLTLALSQMLWGLALQWVPVTGGSDGLSGIQRPVVPGLDQFHISFWRPHAFYFLALAVALLVYALLAVVVASPFGRTLEGIRENEHRMRALGCPTGRYRLAAFVLAGGLAGVAGVLAALYNGNAGPGMLHWGLSGLVLIAVIAGGARSLFGPALGAILIVVMQTAFPSLSILIGVACIAVVLFLPGGIASLARRAA
jgi:branched-chain amino acid transport system permease protein